MALAQIIAEPAVPQILVTNESMERLDELLARLALVR